MIDKSHPLALCCAALSPTAYAQTSKTLDKPNIYHLEQQTHAALAQYHRWYQVYEVPFTAQRIANQKDILSDDVEIVSQMGSTKGKAGLEERLKVFTGWQNAHHVQDSNVSVSTDGLLLLEADIVYQNIRPDDSKHSYTLHYSAQLRPRGTELPVFKKLLLKPTGEIKDFRFESAYAENRAKSFMHYWLFLVETAHGNSEKFQEMLADGFAMELGDKRRLDNWVAFDAWIKSINNQIATSTHTAKNFTLTDRGDDGLQVSVDFDWKGVNREGQHMVAETHHEWLLTNNQDERFARLKKMTVTMLRPFQLVR